MASREGKNHHEDRCAANACLGRFGVMSDRRAHDAGRPRRRRLRAYFLSFAFRVRTAGPSCLRRGGLGRPDGNRLFRDVGAGADGTGFREALAIG